MRRGVLVIPLVVVACVGDRIDARHPPATGGDPERGAQVIRAAGCGACHDIPGVRGARGHVGPGLHGFATRSFIGGALPNSPANAVRWILDPPAVDPQTAMPALGLSEAQARDVAAYLYTLD